MAVRFDASADRLIRTTNLPAYNSAYTVAFWVYISTDRNTWSDFFSISDNSTNNYDSIGTTSSGTTLQMDCIVSGVGTFPTGTDLATGTWHHIAIVRASATSLTGYLNGVSDLTSSTNVGARTAATRMEFSGTAAEGEFLNGRIACIKMWDAALSAAEILQEMRTIRPQRLANLHAFYPTFPGSGERTADWSGNGRNWTEGGTLTDEDPPPVSWGGLPIVFPYTASAGGITGNLSSTIDAIPLSASGALAISATATPTLGAVTTSTAGALAIVGTATPTLGAVSVSAAGAVAVQGSAAVTIGAVTLSSSSTVSLQASVSSTLGAVALSASGAISLSGALASTLDAVTLSASAGVGATGTLSASIGVVTVGGAAALSLLGALSQSVGTVDVAATGSGQAHGDLSATIAPLSVSASGVLTLQGVGSATLADVTVTGAGVIALAGVGAITVPPVTSAGVASLSLAGSLSQALGAVTLSADGAEIAPITRFVSLTLAERTSFALAARPDHTLAARPVLEIT